MEVREVIVAQAVANAELMAERDALRGEVVRLQALVSDYETAAEGNKKK